VFKKILVAFDNGIKAQKALETAMEIAGNNQAEIFIVTSVKIPEVISASVLDRSLLQELEDKTRKHFEKILDETAAKVKEKGLSVQTAILHGGSGEAIIKFAEKEGVDLITIGSHNRGPVERFLLGLGSVSNYVVNHAKCPVLITKA